LSESSLKAKYVFSSMSGLLDAAYRGDIARMERLLAEGADITERDESGWGVLLWASLNDQYPAMRWLLAEAGASMGEVGNEVHATIWNNHYIGTDEHSLRAEESRSALLKVMMMLEDVPPDFIAKLRSQYAELCTQGKQYRAQLPTYVNQQRASIVTYCPLSCCIPSSSLTLRSPQRTCGRMDCVYELRAKEMSWNILSYPMLPLAASRRLRVHSISAHCSESVSRAGAFTHTFTSYARGYVVSSHTLSQLSYQDARTNAVLVDSCVRSDAAFISMLNDAYATTTPDRPSVKAA
jgi:ankyrin repeat protein